MQAELLDAVADDQPGRLGAEAAALAGRADQDPEVAALVVPVPVVQHGLTDDGTRRLVDDGEVEPVGLVLAGPHPFAGLLLADLAVAAGQTSDVRVVHGGTECFVVALVQLAQDHQVPGERRLVREVGHVAQCVS